MALIGRAEIDAAQSRKYEDVPVPEWGGEVRIMELSLADRGYIEAGQVLAGEEGNPKLKVDSLRTLNQKIVAAGLVDENFKRLYSWRDVNEGKLDDKSARIINRLSAQIQKLSGMGRHAVKEAEGNSAAAPSGSSSSD